MLVIRRTHVVQSKMSWWINVLSHTIDSDLLFAALSAAFCRTTTMASRNRGRW